TEMTNTSIIHTTTSVPPIAGRHPGDGGGGRRADVIEAAVASELVERSQTSFVPGGRVLAKGKEKRGDRKGRGKVGLQLNKYARLELREQGEVRGLLTTAVREPAGKVRSRQTLLEFLRKKR